MGLTKHLPTVGRVFTPMAMLVFLTYEIVGSQTVSEAWQPWVVVGAILTAVGIEAVGILSGHTLEGFWRIGDKKRAWLSFALLMIYTGAGIAILWGNWSLLPIPIIAMVVYLSAALAQSLEVEQAKAETADAARIASVIEKETLDREHERKMEQMAQEAEAQTALRVKLAKEETRKAIALAKVRETKVKVAPETAKAPETFHETAVNPEELTGNKLEIYNVFRENPGASNSQVAEVVGVSRQYVGQVKKELNGSLRI